MMRLREGHEAHEQNEQTLPNCFRNSWQIGVNSCCETVNVCAATPVRPWCGVVVAAMPAGPEITSGNLHDGHISAPGGRPTRSRGGRGGQREAAAARYVHKGRDPARAGLVQR